MSKTKPPFDEIISLIKFREKLSMSLDVTQDIYVIRQWIDEQRSSNKAELLEEMVDRMSNTIDNQNRELHYLRRKNYELDHDKGLLVARIANLEKMITRKA